MKKTFILSLLFCFLFIKLGITQTTKSNTTYNITTLSIAALKDKIAFSKKDFKIVYLFKQYCSATQQGFPAVDSLYKQATQHNFELFVVTTTPKKKQEELLDHLFFNNYSKPFYIIDDSFFLNFHSKLIKAICETCNHKDMGYTDFIIFGKDNQLILHTTYQQSVEEHIAILKTYIK